MTRGLLILWVVATAFLCWSAYQEGQLNIMKWDLKMMRDYIENVERLEKRIEVMQELIDYNEWVVHNAIGTLYERWWKNKALDYLENCYIIGDEKQYEEMEKCDCDECICRDENAYEDIWGGLIRLL